MMEKRRSISKVMSHRPAPAASFCPSSPSSGGESPTLPYNSPRRRKPFPKSPCKVLHKQHSAEDLQIRGALWPSAKNHPGTPNTSVMAATLQDHLNEVEQLDEVERPIVEVATHAASTFSSRQRAGLDSPAFEINKSNGRKGGRRYRSSLSSLILNKKKQPGTPPSPSSSSTSSSSGPPNILAASHLPVNNENSLARRRLEFGLDFPSTESDRNEARNSRSRAPIKITGKVIRKSGSPVRKSKSPVLRNSRSPPILHNSRSPVMQRQRSPVLQRQSSPPAKAMISGGMGNIISMGLGNLFRRKSYSGPALTMKSTANRSSSAKEVGVNVLLARTGMAEGVGSPARGAQVAVESQLQHELRMAHNHLVQWRFLNGRMVAVNTKKWAKAQKALVGAWLGLLELQFAVTQKRLQLADNRLSFKLNTLISPQMKAVERWGNMEKHHKAAISSTKDCLHAAVCRLPLTDHAKKFTCVTDLIKSARGLHIAYKHVQDLVHIQYADPQILSILLQKATNLMAAINGNISTCNSMAQRTVPLAAQLAQAVSDEKPLIQECFELLELASNLQIREDSLRCHLIQLKSLKWKKRELPNRFSSYHCI